MIEEKLSWEVIHETEENYLNGLDQMNRVKTELEEKGWLWVKVIKGQRAGSIAKLYPKDPEFIDRAYKWPKPNSFKARVIKIEVDGVLKWVGLSNTIKGAMGDLVWLPNYKGESVWSCIDPKTECEKALKKSVFDMNDRVLSVGDKVIYINARYGSGMVLDSGRIIEFKATYHKQDNTTSVSTIVCNEEGQESKIAYAPDFIYKEIV